MSSPENMDNNPDFNDLYNNMTQTMNNIITGYNTNINIYNQNISRVLMTLDDYRDDIRAHQTYRNRRQVPRTPNNTRTNINMPRNIRRNYGVTQSQTFTSPMRTFPHMFSLPFRNTGENIWNTNQFQDVVISPTQREIEDATETFTNTDSSNLSYTNCPITMEEFGVGDRLCRIHHCGHLFHESAIMNWFRNHVRCPMCRYDIREYTQQSVYIDPSQNITPADDTESVYLDLSHNRIHSDNDATLLNIPNSENDIPSQITELFTRLLETELASSLTTNGIGRSFTLDMPMTITTTEEDEEDDDEPTA